MLSLPHLIIVFVVALVVFGPEKLPELARSVGKFMAEFRRMTGDFKSTFDNHMRDLEREASERRASTAPPSANQPPYTPPAENSIRNDARDDARNDAPASESASVAAAATGLPMPTPTPAQGIVPSADPRIPVQEASPDVASHESGANGASSGNSAEEPGDAPEPVTDGQHHSN